MAIMDELTEQVVPMGDVGGSEPLTLKHGIDKVLFKGFSHKAEAKKEQITVSLEFWEYIPQTVKATKASGSGGKASGSSGGGTTSSGLSEDYKSYLATDRGVSPASDAVTDAGSAGLQKVAAMPF